MNLADYKKQYPIYENVDDDVLVKAIHEKYYSNLDFDTFAKAIEYELPKVEQPKEPGRTFGGTVKDLGISTIKMAVGVPQTVVGLADLASGGKAGKLAEDVGIKFNETNQILDSWKSDAQKAADAKVAAADGFIDTVKTALQNPSTIINSTIESLGSMGVGGVIGKGVGVVAPKIASMAGGAAAGAIGEGVAAAGAQAESIRQQTDDGELTGKQSGLAALSGVGTSVFGAIGGKLAQKFGIVDIDTAMANGAGELVKSNKGIARRLLEGGVSEGVFEELPQSIQEQMLSNIALDKPVTDGVANAAAMGMLAGGAMGAGAQFLKGNQIEPAIKPPAAEDVLKEQANYEAAQAKAKSDAALPKIQEATSLDEAIVYAQEAVNTPINTGLLNQLPNDALTNNAPEAIDAADILGDENVSNTDDGVASMVDSAIASAGDNVQASVGDLSNQPESSGMGDIAGTSTRSSGGGLLAGAEAAGADAVNRPFATADDAFLTQMRGMTADAKVLSQIDAEIELRGLGPVKQPANVNTSANNPQAQVAGEKIDNEWTAFAPESGTLNIPRSEMPQVKAEHRGAMVNFLNARGIDHVQETVPADSLKPTQQEFSEAKVKKASEYVGGDRSILVSADNHVLDGHHQWLSKLNKGGDVDVIRLNAPITQLLNDVKEFPSSTVESGATTSKVQKPKSPKQYKPKTLLATLRDLGGIALTEKQDVTGEVKGFAPGGYNQVFKQASNRSLKGLIESGDLDEYLPYNMRLESNGMNDDAFDSTEAYDYLADKIRNGESVLPYAVVEEAKANQYYQEAQTTAEADVLEAAELLTEDEINEQFTIAANEERETATEARIFNTDSENGDTGSGEREAETTETNASKQAEVTNSNTDLLGDNTTAKQAIADAERAKDSKRNSGNDNQGTFTLTGSNSEADQAAAAGAQDLFTAPIKQQSNTEASAGADVAENTANQSSNGQANDEASEIEYNGVRLYKIKVRNRVEGQPPTEMWAVESTENKARKARGERAIGGDNLSETLDEAKAEADLMLKREAESNQAADAQAKREAEQQEQSRIEADKKSDIDGFGAELNAMQLGKLKETLNKPTSINGVVSPLRDAVRNLVAKGGKPEIKEENVYKGMSRAQYNRADNRAQQEDEKRIREGGKKNVYYITMPDGGMYELGKTAHDFAEHLIAKAESKPQDEVAKATEALTAAGVKGKEKLDTIKDVREGKVTADEVAEAYAPEETKATSIAIPDNAGMRKALTKLGYPNADLSRTERRVTINSKAVFSTDQFTVDIELKNGKWKVFEPSTPNSYTEEQSGAMEKFRSDLSVLNGEVDPAPAKSKVDDFGEKLEGARKDMVRAMAKEYSDDELASLPLSKIWPITDVNLIENKTAAAIAWTARDEIPSKPRKPYALKVWVGKVKILRDIGRIVSKALEVNPELMLQKLKDAQLGQFKSKVALLEAIDRDAWKRIGKVEEYPNAYSYVDGVKQIKPMVRIDVDGVTTTYEASSVADVIDNVNEKLGKEKQEKRMAFEVRGSSKGGYFINKKGDKNYTKLKTFDSSKEAFEFLRNNYDEVVAAWDATKDRLNVKESDVRNKENRPRTGEDYRKGKDVSSEEFATTFGFRGIQFGEWVKQGGKDNDRQGALNAAYDALMDLANIINVPPKALSLEGTLGLSFGARGKGSAAAHFEPGNLVINLTKTQGAGTLAHEWFHALDNYFSRKRGGEKSMAEVKSQQAYREGNYITYKPEPLYIHKVMGGKGVTAATLKRRQEQNPTASYLKQENWIKDPKHPEGVRPEVEQRFADLVDALNTSPMKQRARSIDGVKEGTDGYWSRIIELGARAFENYVIHKMQLNGYDNDYLANVVRVDSFNRDSSRFPYLLDEEVAPVAEAFDNLFSEIKTKETDSGNVAMFSRANQPIFYSALTRAIEEIKTNKADPRLWKGMIKNLAQKGVKPDEVEWTGVNEWLDLQTSAVTKEQVLEYLNANGVQVTETMLGDKWRERVESRMEEINDEVTKLVEEFGIIPDLTGDAKVKYESLEKEFNDLDDRLRSTPEYVDETKYEKYTVAGGSNYKELLLTLPTKINDTPLMSEIKSKLSDPNISQIVRENLTAQLEHFSSKQKLESGFKSSHFVQRNILAHVRFDERTDADGNKVLFINEIQSDWGQEGKKKGFIDIKQLKGFSFKGEIEGVVESPLDESFIFEYKGRELPAGINSKEKAINYLTSHQGETLTAPFVTKTDAWVGLAMKRMMRYAAENGFDKVAFISGEQAADLYDLSKQVKSIYYSKNQDGTYDLDIMTKDDKDIRRSDLTENQLVDNVGKEIAEKIVNSDRKSGSFTGLDLRVGGEGMRTFYNSIVPKVAKDVLKKVGGGKVESLEIGVPNKAIKNEYGEIVDVEEGSLNNQISFTITPEMREKVMGGLPLFNRETNIAKGLPKQAIQNAVNALRSNWKNAPEIIVVQDMRDPAIRKAVRDENQRQLSQGAEGQPEGFFDAGKVYIVASEMNSADDVIRVVFHETLGHYGLRGVYGDKLDRVLDSIYIARRQLVLAKATQYGLDFTKQSDRRIAAEEVLAEMAQTNPQAGFVQRAIAAIRNWLRKHGFNLQLTDNDIVVNYLLPARGYVVNGEARTGVDGLVAAFNRSSNQTDTPQFEKLSRLLGSSSAARDMISSSDKTIINSLKSNAKNLTNLLESVTASSQFDSSINIPFSMVSEMLNVTQNEQVLRAIIRAIPIDVMDFFMSKQLSAENVLRNKSMLKDMFAVNGKSDVPFSINKTALALARVVASTATEIASLTESSLKGNATSLANTNDLVFSTHSKSITENTNFLKWFGNSKVVDADGKPLVVYHGGTASTEFSNRYFNSGSGDGGWLGKGFYFTPDYDYAQSYVDNDERKQLLEVFVTAKNPYIIQNSLENGSYSTSPTKLMNELNAKNSSEVQKALKDQGYDSIILKDYEDEGAGIIEVVAFESNQIKSANNNNGDFDPANPDIRFSRSNAQQSNLIPKWDAPTDNKLDDVVYALQDKHIDLKRVSQSIKKAGTDIADRWNAYLQEELYHGRTAKRTQDFIKNDLDPLIEDMRMRGVAMADFEEYLWARHAEERNIQIAKINPKMPDGGSGMSTQDARDYLANLSPSNKTKYEALARRIDLINRKSRQVLIDYGLESTATIASWEAVYKNYVPLMREDMDAGFGNGTGQGFSVKGNSAKRATGSNRAVVDIIANIAQQYEKNVIRGEKNRVATALIGLAKLNPNESFWQVDTPPTLKTINKATGLVETRTDPNYKNRDNVVVARIRNRLGKIEERSVVFSQFDERAMRMAASIKNLDQDQMGELLGAASSFTRYFASINTQYNPVFGIVNITRDVQGALLNLSTTPIANRKAEVLKNTGAALLGIYQDLRSERKTGKPANNQWSALFEEFQREGGQTGYRDMFKNAKERSDALKNALDPTWWKESKIGKAISLNGAIANQEQWIYDKAIKPIFDWLSDYNNALENAVRLSVYKSALDNGSTKQEAASLAKNISVNFNRKGEMGRQIGSLYAFFNASVQGSARIGETLTSRDANGKYTFSKIGKRIIQGGLLLGSMQALLLAAAGYGDDDPPEFLRNRSLIIPMDWFGLDNKYFTIPMPLGFNAIPAFGRITTEWALSGGKDTQKRVIGLMNMLLDVTNPIGNAGLSMQTLAPTLLDPVAALAENKDSTGRPIYREDFNSLNPTAGYTRSKDKAWAVSVELARYINLMTGGTDYKQGAISPTADQIEYLVGQFTGGVGREVMKAGTTVDSLVSGEDLPPYKIPLVGRFYGNASGQASQGAAFYQNVRELNEHEAEIKGRRENGEDVASYIQEHPEARLAKQGDLAMRQVNALRKRQRQLKEGGESRDAIKKIDERITVIMTKFNERIEAKKEARQ